MLIYKGFIKVSRYGDFYPISRITKLSPVCCNPLLTEIHFNDESFIVVDYPMIKLIDLLNKAKKVNNDR